MAELRLGIITCSDTRGEADDTAGKALTELIAERGWTVTVYTICPDDSDTIEAAIVSMAEAGIDIVLTCGGTGLGPRDVTPEATLAVCDREVPGIADHLRAESLKVTGRAMLSRGVSAARGRTLVINLPGSERAARECFGFVADQFEHAVEMMQGGGARRMAASASRASRQPVSVSTRYFDHAATSWPKPPGVAEEITRALAELGGNPGRGAYRMAVDTARAIHSARRDIAAFLGVADSKNLLFQPGCTQALNLALFGLLRPGDRVVVCPTEHNAVARPLNVLASRGVELVFAETDEAGFVDPDTVQAIVATAPTRAVVCQHAGNVTGTIQPVADLADIAHEHGALMIVDGAQAGGHLAVDLGTLGADVWACSGHKGLLGPQGVGLLYLAPDCEPNELVFGGTGQGESELPIGPKHRPDRYEAGTPNVPGIAGLGAAVRWLAENDDAQREKEARLARRLAEGIESLGSYRILGRAADEPRVPVVSVVHASAQADEIAYALDKRYGIAVRSGLHCAPWAHRSLGTLETGALRLSIGYGLGDEDVDLALEALRVLGAEFSRS